MYAVNLWQKYFNKTLLYVEILCRFSSRIFVFVAAAVGAAAVIYIWHLHSSLNSQHVNNQIYDFSNETKFIQILTFYSQNSTVNLYQKT